MPESSDVRSRLKSVVPIACSVWVYTSLPFREYISIFRSSACKPSGKSTVTMPLLGLGYTENSTLSSDVSSTADGQEDLHTDTSLFPFRR